MKRYFFLLLIAHSSWLAAISQNIGIGTNNPQNKLHVAGGFRLDTLANGTDSGLLKHDENGVVYGLKFTGNITDVLRGDGTFGSGGTGSVGWTLNGNSGTNPVSNFIGTTDNQPLSLRVNNTWAGQLDHIKNNFSIGIGALQNNTTGTQNVGFGHWALLSNTEGSFNTSVGTDALSRNTSGSSNTAVGNWALILNTTGNDNTGIGNNALQSNTSGNSNTAVGHWALFNNTTGERNTAIGDNAMRNNGGNDNTAMGYWALLQNTTGDSNMAIGNYSLYANTTGSYNTAVGYESLNSNITGTLNTATGLLSMRNNTYGNFNTADGVSALYHNQAGNYNTAIGYSALYNTGTSYYNTCVGYLAGGLTNHSYMSSCTFLGAQADGSTDVFNSTAIGDNAYVSTSNTMAFGNGTSYYAFGRSTVEAGAALQVGGCFLGCSGGAGAYLSYGGTWTNGSSITFKEDFSSLDKKETLEKISSLNISRWKYKNSNNEYHIGPIAEEFYKLFKVGTNEKYLSTIDPSGVALAGVQELIIEKKEQQAVIDTLTKKIDQQQQQIDQLIKEVQALKKN